MRRLLVAEFLAVALLTVLAAIGFHRVFVGTGAVAPIVGGGLLAVALAGIATWRKMTAWSSALLSSAGFVAYTIYAALSSTAPNVVPTPTTFRELFGGLTGGWAELLTVSLPARAEPRLLVATIALAWLGGAVGAELVARSRSTVFPVLPPLGTYLASLTFAASEPASPRALSGGVAAATLVVLLLHANRWASLEPELLRGPRRRGADAAPRPSEPRPTIDVPGDRWVLVGLPVVAVAVGLAVAGATLVPTRDGRFDPRSFRTQRVEREVVTTPLASVKAELKRNVNEPPVVLSLELPSFRDARSIPRLRFAILDRFDGASWSSTAQYTKVGSVLPDGPELEVASRDVQQRITLRNFALGPWLPAADRPVRVDLGGQDVPIAYDAVAGTVIAEAGVPEEFGYEVVSRVATPTESDLAAAVPLTGESVVEETVLPPGMPDAIRAAARDLTEGAGSTPYAQLKALEAGLRSRYGYSEEVGAGHSYGRIERFVVDEKRGYAEQFAATFALMARSLGFPARLAVGYLTSEVAANGEIEVLTDITTRQTHVWPEVALSGIGWVAFEPTPDRVPSDPAEPAQTPEVAAGGGLVEAQPVSETGGGTAPTGGEEDGPFLTGRWILMLSVLFAAFLLVVLLLVAKALVLRQRRRREGPAEQVLGAWASVTDRLLEVGVPVEASMTAREVVGVARDVLAPAAVERLRAMVPLVTLALYAPVVPQPERAQEMWEHADAFRREALLGQPWWTGLVVALNPKPLVHSLGRR